MKRALINTDVYLLHVFFLVDTGAPSGTIYLAEIQNKARGTKDHKWHALNRGNLYLSIVIHRPPPATEDVWIQVYHLHMGATRKLERVELGRGTNQ
jgi:biotin-(acetyl-CoA carboxylase) ligase